MIRNTKLINILAGTAVLTGSVVIAMTSFSRLTQPVAMGDHTQPVATERPTVAVGEEGAAIDPLTGFAFAAFPPTITDKEWHEEAWTAGNCLDCHETGVGKAPEIRHYGIPALAMESNCRTCHVIEPGKLEAVTVEDHGAFLLNAFPPMMPNNDNHVDVWNPKDCLMCHTRDIDDAPQVKHLDMPELLLESSCRTCHVQVRAHQSIPGR